MKIILAGLPKSGTTWLYHRFRMSMPRCEEFFFEAVPPDERFKSNFSLLIKLLIGPVEPEYFIRFNEFDRKVFICRDPRDQLVSQILYEAAYHVLPARPPKTARNFIRMLKCKESAPSEVPLHALFCEAWDCSLEAYLLWVKERHRKALLFKQLYPDYFILTYEELVDGKVFPLENYLGFRLKEASIPADYNRVVRAQTYGSWRHWFTAEDVFILTPFIREILRAWQYDHEDWALDPKPMIRSEEASGFVRRVYRERLNLEAQKSISGIYKGKLKRLAQLGSALHKRWVS